MTEEEQDAISKMYLNPAFKVDEKAHYDLIAEAKRVSMQWADDVGG